MCDKKIYDDKYLANRAITKIFESEWKSGKKPIRSYYCDICKGYHLTSQQEPSAKSTDLRYRKFWRKLIGKHDTR